MTAWRWRKKRRAENIPRRRLWRGVWLLCALAMVPLCFSKEGMDQKTRIEIIRGLLREMAVTKVGLPRGKRGVRLDAQGKLDKNGAQNELRANGLAMNPGSPAQITKIEFKEKSITVEVNGGGRTSKKWYQHIEVGMGDDTEPIAQQQQTAAFGSSITVDYGKPLPDLSVEQLKTVLSSVLDFSRHSPTVLYSPNVTPQVKEAIKNHNVIVGMDRDAVLSAKGSPDRRVREDKPDGSEIENWIYGLPPHVLYVTFDGDQVVSVKQY
jgi:hypothetical protein